MSQNSSERRRCVIENLVFKILLNSVSFIKEWAKQLDADAKHGKKGPLYGLPFSVKDNVGIVGYDSTVGISSFINQPATEDAALVIALKQLGAIPFCKTNTPQTNLRWHTICFHIETEAVTLHSVYLILQFWMQ